MSDLISRQAAIDAIEHRLAEPAYQHEGEDWYTGMNCAESELYDLPPAQPEPCEDAVSREAVLDKAWDAPYEGRYIQVVSVGDIEELPPVTPSHKKGKWVKVTNGRGGHECNICHAYAPSCQNGDEYLSRFCPNCGAKMD